MDRRLPVKEMRYRDKIYASYLTHFSPRDISRESLEDHRKAHTHYYGSLLPGDRNAKILEIGCGYGAFLHFLKKEGYANASGIDISQGCIDLARSFGVGPVERADVFSYLEGKTGEFDTIVALDVLEHFTKDELLEVVESIHRSLKRGGRFIAQVPNAGGVFGNLYRYSDLTHEIAFTIRTITDVFSIGGFEDIVVTPMAPMVGGVRSFLKYLLWKTVNAALRFYLLHVEGLGPYEYVASVNLIASGRKP